MTKKESILELQYIYTTHVLMDVPVSVFVPESIMQFCGLDVSLFT